MSTEALSQAPLEPNVRLLEEIAQQFKANAGQMVVLAVRAVERAGRTENLDPATLLSLLKAKGDEHTLRIYGRIGASLRAGEVRSLTGFSNSGLHKAKTEDRMMSYRLPGQSLDLFPILQFEGAKVRPWVPKLLKHTGNGVGAFTFLTARRTSLDGVSYAEKLIDDDSSPELISQMLSQASRIGDEAA